MKDGCLQSGVFPAGKSNECIVRSKTKMEMLLYTLRRIGISIMTLLLVAAITFFLMNAIPGSDGRIP